MNDPELRAKMELDAGTREAQADWLKHHDCRRIECWTRNNPGESWDAFVNSAPEWLGNLSYRVADWTKGTCRECHAFGKAKHPCPKAGPGAVCRNFTPQPKELTPLPWERKDVPWPCRIRRGSFTDGVSYDIIARLTTGVTIARVCGGERVEHITYQQLLDDGWFNFDTGKCCGVVIPK